MAADNLMEMEPTRVPGEGFDGEGLMPLPDTVQGVARLTIFETYAAFAEASGEGIPTTVREVLSSPAVVDEGIEPRNGGYYKDTRRMVPTYDAINWREDEQMQDDQEWVETDE